MSVGARAVAGTAGHRRARRHPEVVAARQPARLAPPAGGRGSPGRGGRHPHRPALPRTPRRALGRPGRTRSRPTCSSSRGSASRARGSSAASARWWRPASATRSWRSGRHRSMAETGGLLLVHAHPDDECMGTGGLIARSVEPKAPRGPRDLHRGRGGRDPRSDAGPGGGEVRDWRRSAERSSRARWTPCGAAARHAGAPHARLPRLRDDGHRSEPAAGRLLEGGHRRGDRQAGARSSAGRGRRRSSATTERQLRPPGPHQRASHRGRGLGGGRGRDRFPEAGEPHAVEKFYEIAFAARHGPG